MKSKGNLIKMAIGMTLPIALTLSAFAADTQKPQVAHISAQTLENQGVYGDAIKVFYNEAMLIPGSPYPLAGGMEDVNNVPGSEKKAPAEYPNHQGNATGKNTAKNYTVKIIPGPGSFTVAYEGTWAALGGTAMYDPYDSNKKTIILLPPSQGSNVFMPGDTLEVTVATTVVDPAGNAMDPLKNKASQTAS